MSFCGGGSDLPSFYEKHGGCVLSTSINKYMYILTHPYFEQNTIVLKYSKTEIVRSYDEIQHKYFGRVLREFGIHGVEIASVADIPAGTGLGSSSSFMVGLLHSLYCYIGKYVSKERLASEACAMEIQKIGEPIGKQDQYAAAYGGLNFYTFNPDGSVFVEPVVMKEESRAALENNLLLFYLGGEHSASAILKEQGKNVTQGDKEANQIKMCELTRALRDELIRNNIDAMGDLLHQNWMLKRSLASGIATPLVDEKYEIALRNGALGGKLLGAGGGGFMLFYVPVKQQQQVIRALELPVIPFRFDRQGSGVLFIGEKPDVF
jgi:D-glycero-alpha-D-manno-heptose-7-phosphate kinase